MDEDTVEPHDEEAVFETPEGEVEAEIVEEQEVEQGSQKQVPLSALQKERQKRQEEARKRQEAEMRLQLEREQWQRATPSQKEEEDLSTYESATRKDLARSQEETFRIIEERLWIKQNPEKFQQVQENLPNFLKQRPNLAPAIEAATNRYEEAYALMEALTPKQQQQLKKEPSKAKPSPNSPGSVPKAAAMNQAVDLMSMSDAEFSAWRQSQKRRR